MSRDATPIDDECTGLFLRATPCEQSTRFTLRVAGHALLGGGITPLGHSCTSAVGLQLCDSTARMKSNLPFAAARQNP